MSTETPTILETAPAPVAFTLHAESAVSTDRKEIRHAELTAAPVGKAWSAHAQSNYCSENHTATVVYRTARTVVVLFEWDMSTDRGDKSSTELKAFSL